jgi:hypothetical protein
MPHSGYLKISPRIRNEIWKYFGQEAGVDWWKNNRVYHRHCGDNVIFLSSFGTRCALYPFKNKIYVYQY